MADNSPRKAANKEESREVETNKDGGITVKVNVDVSDALTGLKAVTREAREATKAVKELEAESGRINVDSDANKYLGVKDSVFRIGTESGLLFRSPPHDIIEIDTKDALYTEHRYDLSAVPTAQLVEELASRDGVDKAEYEAGSEVFINGREVRFLTPGYVIDGCYGGDDDE